MRQTMTADVVIANRPESVVASPYVGRKNGNIVMMKMPKPKPLVRGLTSVSINAIISSFFIFLLTSYGLLTVFLGYSYPLLILTKDLTWLLECLSNLSRRSRLALDSVYAILTA